MTRPMQPELHQRPEEALTCVFEPLRLLTVQNDPDLLCKCVCCLQLGLRSQLHVEAAADWADAPQHASTNTESMQSPAARWSPQSVQWCSWCLSRVSVQPYEKVGLPSPCAKLPQWLTCRACQNVGECQSWAKMDTRLACITPTLHLTAFMCYIHTTCYFLQGSIKCS